MWYISKQSPEFRIALLADVEYSVGRQNCDIVISDDPTVSRKHATLKCSPSTEGNAQKLTVTDVSKYGTWVNSDRLIGQREVTSGDCVKFGSPKSTYVISYEPLVVTSSCLDNSSKMATKTLLRRLGGHMITEWRDDCHLLVMNSLSVTIKVVNAIVCQKHVVTSAYLDDFSNAVNNKSSPPDPNKYLPPLAESQLNANEVSFSPNPARKTIFQHLLFCFVNSKQLKKLQYTIELCGGTTRLLEGDTSSINEGDLVANNSVVMQCDPDDKTLDGNTRKIAFFVTDVLKRHDKRAISDSEIGYAVLYCSTQKHCNPDIKPGRYAFSHLPSQTFSMQQHTQNSEVLVQDTEIDDLRKPAPKRKRPNLAPESKQQSTSGTNDKNEPKKPELFTAPHVPDVKIKDEPLSVLASESMGWSAANEIHRARPDSVATSITRTNDSNADKLLEETTILKTDIKSEVDSENTIFPTDEANVKQNVSAVSEDLRNVNLIQDVVNQNSKRPMENNDESENVRKKPPKRQRGANLYELDSDDDGREVIQSKTTTKNARRRRNDYESDSDGERDVIPARITEADNSRKQEVNGNVRIQHIDSNGDGTEMRRNQDVDGFMCSRDIIENRVAVCKRYEKEAELPSRCVQSRYANLVTRVTAKPRQETVIRDDGFVMWKGQLVKNFKNFQKSHYKGANQLPKIIGGRDLQVFTNTKRSATIEDMFHQAESQYTQENRMADAMFEMSFKVGAKKTKGSRR